MSNIVAVLIVRCTHTGVYADGRPNPASVTLYDLDEITIQKNRTRAVPVPFGAGTTRPPVDIPMSTRTFVSWHQGDICVNTNLGLITSEIILQLRDKGNCGGPAGTGQALRPAVLNIERVANELRLIIPNNVIPTVLDSIGFMEGEPVTITGLTGAFRKLNATYEITNAVPATGLAGAVAGSYLVVVPSVGPDIAAVTLTGVNLCLSEGRVVTQFNSTGDVGGFGPNVFGYVGGQFLPGVGGGGGGTVAVYDEGILVDAAVSTFDFIGAGVTVTPAGAGAVDVTILGGGGGGETLAATLLLGNTTGGTDILVSTGDSIIGVTDLVLDPGAGGGDNVIIDGLTWPFADGTAGQALITNGAGILSFGDPTPALHAITHIHLGTDEIDGDRLDIDFVPTNYVRTITGPFTTSVEELTSHLAGIDAVLASTGFKTFTAGEALTTGDLVALNTSGEVIRADSSIAGANWEVIGVANQTVGAAAPVLVTTRSGDCPIVRFTATPAGAANGSLVFLSTTSGLATTTPPVAVGNTIFTIGTLQGADGITATPVVVFRPQYLAQRR